MSYKPDWVDEKLRRIAKKRVDFKENIFWYVVVIVFLWIIWYFTMPMKDSIWTWWPIRPTLGRGIGTIAMYMDAYNSPKEDQIEEEYNKILKEKK